MEYNLAGIRQRILIDKLDDEEFDPGVVDRFINDAQRDIFNQFELPFQEKIFSGDIPLNATMFQRPNDVAQIQSQVITAPDGKQMDLSNRYLPFREFNKRFPTPGNETAGDISAWTLYAGNIILSAPTDQSYELTLFYIKTPAKLVEDSDVPEIPEEFEELLVLGAFKRILERNEDYDQAQVIVQQYSQLLDLLVARYGARKADGPTKMGNMQR